MFQKLITVTTGARKEEQLKTLASFIALFLLLSSYYMVKPLRNSQFLKEFDADLLPFFFLFTALLSFAVTKFFNRFSTRIDVFPLIVWTYLIMMACKLAFFVYLPIGGKPATVVFYLWASVYFLLAISILWGCINYIFTSESGERCYGFIAIGGMSGGIAGSHISSVFSQGWLKDYALLFSAGVMGSVLLFVYLALKTNQDSFQEAFKPAKEQEKSNFFSDLKEIWENPYVRSIAVMVYSIAAFNTVLEFQSQKIIDQHMARREYTASFADLNQILNLQAGQEQTNINVTGFDFVFGLKNSPKENREHEAQQFIEQHKLDISSSHFLTQYESYRDQLEGRTRKLFSQISFYQGILGISLLFFASRFLFKYCGARLTSLILPLFYLCVMLALFFPVNILMIESFLVIGYGLNYSLNRAVKELLYTQTSRATIFQAKPLIDGPIRRLGDVTMAIFKLSLTFIFVKILDWPAVRADQLFVATSLFILGFWLYSVWYVGGIYDAKKKQVKASEPVS